MHNEDAITAGRPALVLHNDSSSSSSYVKEKQNGSGTASVEILDEKMDAYMQVLDEGALEPEYRNGVQVIQTGRDVSRFVVDIRDDGDEALTFRSIFLGTVFAGMGAALSQASAPTSLPTRDQIDSAHGYFCARASGSFAYQADTANKPPTFFHSFITTVSVPREMQKGLTIFVSDLPFQTSADVGVYGIFAAHYLHRWEWMGGVLPSTHLGHWHSV